MGSASAFVNLSCQFGETSFQVSACGSNDRRRTTHTVGFFENPFTLSLLWTEKGTKRFSCIVIKPHLSGVFQSNEQTKFMSISDVRYRHDNSLYSWKPMVIHGVSGRNFMGPMSCKQIDVKRSTLKCQHYLTLLTWNRKTRDSYSEASKACDKWPETCYSVASKECTRDMLQRSIKSVWQMTRDMLQRSIKSVWKVTRDMLQRTPCPPPPPPQPHPVPQENHIILRAQLPTGVHNF